MNHLNIGKKALLVASMMVVGTSASVAGVVASKHYTSPQVFTTSGQHKLMLNKFKSVNLWFNATKGKRYAILYNAECSVKAKDTNTWYDLDIKIRQPGSTVFTHLPTGDQDNAFCTSHGNNKLDNWGSHSSHVTFTASKTGWHRINVLGQIRGFTSGDQARIDDTSLIVMD